MPRVAEESVCFHEPTLELSQAWRAPSPDRLGVEPDAGKLDFWAGSRRGSGAAHAAA